MSFTATLIAPPNQLPRALVDRACARLSGSAPRWLSENEAAELDLKQKPEDLWTFWEALQAEGVDLVVQPSPGRRKAMLLADMDSTMIEQECIDELAEMAGMGDRVRAITARAMDGALDFEAALTERVALLKGLPASVITDVLDQKITFTPGGATLVATMRAKGGYAALVSGGFTAFTGPVAAHLGFDENRANTLLVTEGVLTGQAAPPILGRAAKVEALHQITARRGLTPQDVIAVGDGANDLGMLKLAGTGVALHAKPAVAAQCDIRINHGDLTALLFLQGYAREDFADVIP